MTAPNLAVRSNSPADISDKLTFVASRIQKLDVQGNGALNTSGNAATATLADAATVLETPRAINGVNFDGSAPITVPAAAGTLTGATLATGVRNASITHLDHSLLQQCANNAAAIVAGLVTGDLYRTGGDPDLICIVD